MFKNKSYLRNFPRLPFHMIYASFWQRFFAALIDFLVFVPALFIQAWLEGESKVIAYCLTVPMAFMFCAYSIYGHGRFGKTIGKHVVGIRVVRLSGDRVRWREAWLRSSVDVMFSSLYAVAALWALASISDQQYYGVDWLQRTRSLEELQPRWLAWAGVATQVWGWSEILVMLFNDKRRALHDYIAGTVVIREGLN